MALSLDRSLRLFSWWRFSQHRGGPNGRASNSTAIQRAKSGLILWTSIDTRKVPLAGILPLVPELLICAYEEPTPEGHKYLDGLSWSAGASKRSRRRFLEIIRVPIRLSVQL